MNCRNCIWVLLFMFLLPGQIHCYAKTIHHKHYKFIISMPDQMVEIRDTSTLQGLLYFDTVASVVLMISESESKFRSVKDYLDCSREKLQDDLRNNYEDTTLELLSCAQSAYYPEKTTVLHFRVSVIPDSYDSHVMYFIHHRRKDIQVSFSYKKNDEQKNLKYIDGIMKTLVLK